MRIRFARSLSAVLAVATLCFAAPRGQAEPPIDQAHARATVSAWLGEALRAHEQRAGSLQAVQRTLARRQVQLAYLLAWLADGGEPVLSDPAYLPIALLRPGQLRYARLNVDDKVAAAVTRGAATPRPPDEPLLAHDDGRSILALGAALPVILGPDGYVLVDGHHDLLSSLALGATSVPVRQVADLSAHTEETFWDAASERGFVYPRAVGGAHQVPPRWFDELVDDPIRYFAAVIARKCASAQPGAADTSVIANPVWVKVGKDIPFVEFMIADALFSAGLRYDNQMGDAPSPALVEQARAILLAHPVDGVRVIAEPTPPLELNGCEHPRPQDRRDVGAVAQPPFDA